MKKYLKYLSLVLACMSLLPYICLSDPSNPEDKELKIIVIRHGEKPKEGSNLTCKGLNRSLKLPALIRSKFGVPDFIYVPALKLGEKTKRARMYETVIPLAVQFNLDINSSFAEEDSAGVSTDMLKKKGTVLVSWEHKAITGIVRMLGIKDPPRWGDDDFNSILIITYKDGKATMTKDEENLKLSDDCP